MDSDSEFESNTDFDTETYSDSYFDYDSDSSTERREFVPYTDGAPNFIPPIAEAVVAGDVEQVKRLLESGISVNTLDPNDNTPLHFGVGYNASMEVIDFLLTHPDIDLEKRNIMCFTKGYTPLLFGLRSSKTNPDIIMRLIEAGCNVNTKNTMGETPLHLAVARNYPENILLKLIEKGADINAQDITMCTPLNYAVRCGNEAAIYLLLYYNVDVSISNPIIDTLRDHQSNLAEILFDYYDFSDHDQEEFGFKCLLIAIQNDNRVAMDLLRAGVNINYSMPEVRHPIFDCIRCSDSKLFKEMWPRVNYDQIIEGGFLVKFIKYCNFPTSEWLECCYLILNCSQVTELINPSIYNSYYDPVFHSFSVLYNICITFYKKHVKKDDRLGILYNMLSYGATVDMKTLHMVYRMYGFDEELDALIQAGDQFELQRIFHFDCDVFLIFYILLEEKMDRNEIFRLIKKQIIDYYSDSKKFSLNIEKRIVLHTLQLFSLTHEERSEVLRLLSDLSSTVRSPDKDIKEYVIENLKYVPDVPSLTEMCRSQARKFIKQTFQVKQPYQFYDAVNKLDVPYDIKKIITLMKPLYISMYT